MKKILPLVIITFLCNFYSPQISAQCGFGYTNCSLNWDYLDFFPSAGITPYTNLARSQSQVFTFGTQRLTIAHNFTGSNAIGEDGMNTGEAGSFGAGQDVHFRGNGTITMNFQNNVENVRFSIYDIDYNQTVTITSNTGSIITLTRLSSSNLNTSTLLNSGTVTSGSTTAVANNSIDGTVNVTITGVVSSISIVTSQTGTKTNGFSSSQEDGSFWLSDISACSAGAYSNNFFQVAKPYNNQPGYVLTARNNTIYYVDPVTGISKSLFTDPGHTNINSMAYDPVNKYLYYVFSLTGSSGSTNEANYTLRRYNYNTDTFGVVLADVRALIPTFDAGVESGAAAFYDGSLYLGIESSSSGTNESIVWKIDFDGAQNPIAASQLYALPGVDHDWADISVVNGVLYDFDGSSTQAELFHMNLYSHDVTSFTPPASLIPRQSAVDWNNNVLHLGQPNTGTTAEIAPYLYNGAINNAAKQPITFNGTALSGSWGDAAEAFKPRVDFGDAPATYDPAASDPAINETSTLIYLGNNSSNEWSTRGQTATATADNFDDAIVTSSLLNPVSGTFYAEIRYLNNTGSTATIIAWIDFNNNGIFDVGEGRTLPNLPSSASTQIAYLNWTGISTSLTDGSFTYMRLRIAKTSSNMTASSATGYFGDGEVEDHRLMVTSAPLTVKLHHFTATKNANETVQTAWQVSSEKANTTYTLQRSNDMQSWKDINTQVSLGDQAANSYTFLDAPQTTGTIYYRLKIAKSGGYFSEIRKVEFEGKYQLIIAPNPASSRAEISIQTNKNETISLHVFDATGKIYHSQSIKLTKGTNKITLNIASYLNGLYWIQMKTDSKTFNERLVIKK